MPSEWQYPCDNRHGGKKNFLERADIVAQNRQKARALLKEGQVSATQIAKSTGVSRTTLGRMKQCHTKDDEVTMEKMLTALGCKRGACTLLTPTEEKMIAERLLFVAER